MTTTQRDVSFWDSSSDEETSEVSYQTCVCCQKQAGVEELYRCTTCKVVEADSSNENSRGLSEPSSIQSTFCDMCIFVLHIRNEHEVIDHRGCKPALCSTHGNICVFFCHDCLIVFCRLCTEIHCRHDFMPISKEVLLEISFSVQYSK